MLETEDYAVLLVIGLILVAALKGGSETPAHPQHAVTNISSQVIDECLRAFCKAKGFDVLDVEYRTDGYDDITCYEEKDGWMRLEHFSKEEFDAWLKEGGERC